MAEMSEGDKDRALRAVCGAVEGALSPADRAVVLVLDASGQVHLCGDAGYADIVPLLRRAADALEARG